MKILAPILLIIGTLYSWYMALYYPWLASCYYGNERAKLFCSIWFYVFGIALVVSLLSWVAYAVTLWRRKSPGVLCAVYLILWGLLYSCGLLCVNCFLTDKM